MCLPPTVLCVCCPLSCVWREPCSKFLLGVTFNGDMKWATGSKSQKWADTTNQMAWFVSESLLLNIYHNTTRPSTLF